MVNQEELQEAIDILNPVEEAKEVDENQGELELSDANEGELDETADEEVTDEEVTEETDKEEAKEPDEGYTISSLAEAIEIEPAELYEVMVPLSDHGEPMSIGKLKDGYEALAKENPQLVEQVATLQKTVEENKSGTSPQQQLSQAEFQANVAMAQAQEEFNAIDWADLEEYDPAQAVLKKQKIQDKYNQANYTMQQAGQQRQANHQTWLNEQLDTRNKLIPEWSDREVQNSEEARIKTIMLDAGYSEEVVETNADPISFMLLRELMQLREEKAAGAKSIEKVRKAPQVLRNSAKKARTSKDKQDKIYTKAQKSGSEQDAIAAVRGLLGDKLP